MDGSKVFGDEDEQIISVPDGRPAPLVTRLNSAGNEVDPALLRPDLGGGVTGGIQSRELNSVIPPGR